MAGYLFIRNDDVWTLDGEFRFFFDQAIQRGLPVVHAVIPGKMEKALIRFLCRAKEKTPGLLDIVQHGWVHANYSPNDQKYEFGLKRSLKMQRQDIRQGLKKMRSAFGGNFTSAFVPPYHGYDQRTLQVIHEEGFRIFSAGLRRTEIKGRFIAMPAQISFSRYEKDKMNVQMAKDMITALARSMARRQVSGLVTHHSDFSTMACRKELIRFFNCIAALRNKEGWRVLLFSDIIGRYRKSMSLKLGTRSSNRTLGPPAGHSQELAVARNREY